MARLKRQLNKEPYIPSKAKQAVITMVYGEVDEMIEQRDKTWTQFNDRTLKDFIDDGDKRLNSFVPSKEFQGKEEWQANVALTTVRDKQKRMLAGFSLRLPETHAKAFGEDKLPDIDRAKTALKLIEGSYLQEENPILENFWESWECMGKGTVIQYEGYLKTKAEQKFIKSFDIVSGEIKVGKKEVNIDDKCVSYTLPLTEFFIKSFYIADVQEQPAVAWIRYYDEQTFDYEFGNYADVGFVKMNSQLSKADTDSFFYKKEWSERSQENKIEVVRYYNIVKDFYIIVANGVLLLKAPLLWRVNGRKVYPFGKTIAEPFAGRHFFYGKSLPDILLGLYDINNTLFNSLLDKEYRAIDPALLVGKVNQDAFELEDEIVTADNKIYVDDIDQVKPMPTNTVTNADVQMLSLVAKGINDSAPSLPDLLAQKKVTAREVVIAEEKLREVKSLYNTMMEDLWRQKYYLRLANIQLNYPQPREIVDEKGNKKTYYRTFVIDNAILDEETGEIGILAVQFRNLTDSNKKKIQKEVDIEEEMMAQQGINYKKIVANRNYFDNYTFQFEIVPESLYKSSTAREQSSVLEEIEVIARRFPQIFALNQEEYFADVSKAYNRTPDKALKKFSEYQEALQLMGGAKEGEEEEGGGAPPAKKKEQPPVKEKVKQREEVAV